MYGFFGGPRVLGFCFFSGVFLGPVSPKPASVLTAPVQAVHRLTAPRQGSFRESGTDSLCCSSFFFGIANYISPSPSLRGTISSITITLTVAGAAPPAV